MSQPIVIVAVFTPVEGKRDEAVAALSRAVAEVHEEEGCEIYAIHDSPDGTIVMLEKWSSVEALDAHGAGEAVARLGGSLAGLITGLPEVTRLTPIPAGTELQGAL